MMTPFEIPKWLQKSIYAEQYLDVGLTVGSSEWIEHMSEPFSVPTIPPDTDEINNIEDFMNMIEICKYWMYKDDNRNNYPLSFYIFALFNQDLVLETLVRWRSSSPNFNFKSHLENILDEYSLKTKMMTDDMDYLIVDIYTSRLFMDRRHSIFKELRKDRYALLIKNESMIYNEFANSEKITVNFLKFNNAKTYELSNLDIKINNISKINIRNYGNLLLLLFKNLRKKKSFKLLFSTDDQTNTRIYLKKKDNVKESLSVDNRYFTGSIEINMNVPDSLSANFLITKYNVPIFLTTIEETIFKLFYIFRDDYLKIKKPKEDWNQGIGQLINKYGLTRNPQIQSVKVMNIDEDED